MAKTKFFNSATIVLFLVWVIISAFYAWQWSRPMPNFIKIGFKLCPWDGIEWVDRLEQENIWILKAINPILIRTYLITYYYTDLADSTIILNRTLSLSSMKRSHVPPYYSRTVSYIPLILQNIGTFKIGAYSIKFLFQ